MIWRTLNDLGTRVANSRADRVVPIAEPWTGGCRGPFAADRNHRAAGGPAGRGWGDRGPGGHRLDPADRRGDHHCLACHHRPAAGLTAGEGSPACTSGAPATAPPRRVVPELP